MPQLPIGPLQASDAGFLLSAAGLLDGVPKQDTSKKRERDGSLALGGRGSFVRRNNQPKVSGSRRRAVLMVNNT